MVLSFVQEYGLNSLWVGPPGTIGGRFFGVVDWRRALKI
jgi:hypothetical protein